MSRKNNAKLYKARHAAALERNKERRERSEARRIRREHMRLLTEGLAQLGCCPSDKTSGAPIASSATAAFASPSCMPSSSSSSSLAAPVGHALAAADGGETVDGGSPASASNGSSAPESTVAQKDAELPDAESKAAQHRREENRVRKSIWKGAAGGRTGKRKESNNRSSSGAGISKKKDRSKQKPTVLVRGKGDGIKMVVRARDKKVLKQMEKRRRIKYISPQN